MTAHTIGYTIVQVCSCLGNEQQLMCFVQARFALSTQEKWTPEDGTAFLPLLFHEVVNAIEDATPKWREELFAY